MISENNLKAWFDELKNNNKDTPHIVIGYGSLLSQESRLRYSNIRSLPLPLTVKGWERSWVTRSTHEEQTYVGAYQNRDADFNGHAFSTNIDAELQKREQDYRFAELALRSLEFCYPISESEIELLSTRKFYVCETLEKQLPSRDFPVNNSYIDTCLKGCAEVGGVDEVKRFIETTNQWPVDYKFDDRSQPNYPRAAVTLPTDWLMFDEIQGVINNDGNSTIIL
jgi:hypothetical protein